MAINETRSVEQFCRDLLELAISDGLVGSTGKYAVSDPQSRTSGELVGVANMAADYMSSSTQRVVGILELAVDTLSRQTETITQLIGRISEMPKTDDPCHRSAEPR